MRSVRRSKLSKDAHDLQMHERAASESDPDLDVPSALGGTRNPNLLIRSQMLYPIELRALEDRECMRRSVDRHPKTVANGHATNRRTTEIQLCTITRLGGVVGS